MVGLRVGSQRLVIVSGKEAIKKFYSTDAMNGRPNGFFYRIRSFNQRLGVVFTDGEFWEVQRKFALKVLRQMGMGRSNMIEQVEQECAEMVRYLRQQSNTGQLIEMQHAFDIPVLNILWVLVAGYRQVYQNHRRKNLYSPEKKIQTINSFLHIFHFVRFDCILISTDLNTMMSVYKSSYT